MDIIDQVRALASKIEKDREHILTEEATKNAFILPFINALGYNVFDVREVVPEFTADAGEKKGEKVDYAIIKDGKPIILIECKWCGVNLDEVHKNQLLRYFTFTEAKVGILTNGILYRFYTDLDKENLMDDKPFLELNLLDLNEQIVSEMKRFAKAYFSLNELKSVASELKYTREVKSILNEQLINPSEEFVKFFVKQVYQGSVTQTVKSLFANIVKKAFRHFVEDKIMDRLKSAMTQENTDKSEDTKQIDVVPPDDSSKIEPAIATTSDECEAFYVVKSIIRQSVDINRVVLRDAKTMCNVLLDDTIRKPICRFYFSPKYKRIGIIKADKTEDKFDIEKLDDIYKYSEQIITTLSLYEKKYVAQLIEAG